MVSLILVSTFILWLFFIALTAIVDDKTKQLSDLSLIKRILVIAFVVFDVIYNFTIGTLIFLELPSLKRKTLTLRLRYILFTKAEWEWRFKLAYFMCKYMIEPFDWGHCRLHKIK